MEIFFSGTQYRILVISSAKYNAVPSNDCNLNTNSYYSTCIILHHLTSPFFPSPLAANYSLFSFLRRGAFACFVFCVVFCSRFATVFLKLTNHNTKVKKQNIVRKKRNLSNLDSVQNVYSIQMLVYFGISFSLKKLEPFLCGKSFPSNKVAFSSFFYHCFLLLFFQDFVFSE